MEFAISLLLLFSFVASQAQAVDPCASTSSDSGISVHHIYGKCSPFSPTRHEPDWVDTVLDMATKDPQRVDYLYSLSSRKTTAVPIAPGQQLLNIGNYVLRVKIGTPGQVMYMVLDTSSIDAWAPCSGCTGCSTTTTFSPTASSTYGGSLECSVPECAQVSGLQCPTTGTGACTFNQSYGGSSFTATLVRDSLTLGPDVVANYTFGCINTVWGASIPPQGLLGLGRGPMSLLSQTGSLYSGIFSYCLPSFRSYYFSGSLKLGPLGQPKTIRTTPLLRNPHRSSLYYVNLTGISVGRVTVPIDPQYLTFDLITGSGTVVDSGTVITQLMEPVYNATRDEFRKQVPGPFSSVGAFDTCFTPASEVDTPVITLHLEGLDLKLPLENSLIHRSSGPQACLAMAATPNNVNSVLNVIASFQQQNLRVVYDPANSKLGIARELCN